MTQCEDDNGFLHTKRPHQLIVRRNRSLLARHGAGPDRSSQNYDFILPDRNLLVVLKS
jgi:hypothetical protein